jgi:hypothetical protein
MEVSVASEPEDDRSAEDVSLPLAALAAAAGGAELRDCQVELAPGVVARAVRVHAPQGVTLDGRAVTAPVLELLDVTAEVDVAAVLDGALGAARLDLDLLDAVSGHAHVDAIVGLVPAVPRLKSALRLTIREGAIDFTQLERGFHALADAVLNFRVKGDRLELEKDIPLVPWDESTLLAWELDADDRALAAKNRVRLGRLADVQILESGRRDAGGKGCYGLGSLALEGIDVDVSVLRPRVDVALAQGEVQLGLDGAPGLQGLRLHGAVRCAQDGPARATKVAVSVQALHAALRGLSALGFVLDAQRLVVKDVSGDLTFEGLTPTRLTVSVPRVLLEGVRLGQE